jgi:hypothetical protein
MQTPHTAATPGASPIRTAALRTAVAPFTRPRYGLPMDGDGGAPAGGGDGGGAGTATAVAPAPGGAGTGQAPATSTTGATAGTGQAPAGSPLFNDTPPAPAQPTAPAGQQQTGTGEVGVPAGDTPTATGPVGDRPLDQFPPEIRDHIAQLRRENAENRVKAKTAEESAEAQKREWLDKFAKAFGLVEDTPAEQQVPPEQRVEQLTQQVTASQEMQRATEIELATWKAAAAAGANPQRLTDSRTFMKQVAGLDPADEQFSAKVAAAIGAALEADDYYKAAGPAPAAPPPVASSGDFAGGPSGGAPSGPQSVDDFREELRQRRSTRT